MNTENQVNDMGSRAIINSGYDISNVVPIEKEIPRIRKTLDTCFDILAQHCGPFSKYAMLVNNHSLGLKFEPNVFTRDGIGIMEAVEFASPLERYIKNLLTYIGTRVDNKAKDGTTTSMMLSAHLLSHFFQIHQDIPQDIPQCSFREVMDMIDQAVTSVQKSIASVAAFTDLRDEEKYTEQEAMQQAGRLAFIQALSSSGGNVELARHMKTIFEVSPRCLWDYISYRFAQVETDKEFSVEVPEYDVALKCSSSMEAQFNTGLGTEYENEDVALYIYADSCVDGDFRMESFLAYLEQDAPQDKHIILCTQRSSARLTTTISNLNKMRTYPITLWEYASREQIGGRSWAYELMIAAAQLGITPVNESLRTGVEIEYKICKRVHWFNGVMYIHDTILTEEGTVLHPDYIHPEKAHPYFTYVYQTCKAQLEMYASSKREEGKLKDYFSDLLSRLLTVKRPTLVLGGTVHAQAANYDVVRDVEGAIMASLTSGVVPSLFAVSRALTTSHTREQHNNFFLKLIVDSINRVASHVMTSGLSPDHVDINNQYTGPDVYLNVADKNMTTRSFNDYLKHLDDGTVDDATQYPPIQSLVMYEELLKRVRELLCKFMWSSQIIVAGALMIKDEEKKDVSN